MTRAVLVTTDESLAQRFMDSAGGEYKAVVVTATEQLVSLAIDPNTMAICIDQACDFASECIQALDGAGVSRTRRIIAFCCEPRSELMENISAVHGITLQIRRTYAAAEIGGYIRAVARRWADHLSMIDAGDN